MKYVEYGRTGLRVSRIGLGGFPFGGRNLAAGWDPWTAEGRRDAIATIHRALERGMFTQEGHGADPSLSYVWRSEYDPETRLCRIAMRFQVQTPTGTREFHATHLQRGYPLAEIRALLEGANLEVLGIYQSFGFRAATEGFDRAYFVARRP